MVKKTILSIGIACCALTTYAQSDYQSTILERISNPLMHQQLINTNNYQLLNKLSQNYPKQNTINVGWLSIFRRYNSGETVQNRTALNTHINSKTMIFDLDGDKLLDWSKININANNEANFSEAQTTLAIKTQNLGNIHSPVVLMLLSNQHTVIDYLNNPAADKLTELGYTVAVMEYPNYGVSLGRGSLQSWLSATRGATLFLNKLTGKKITLVGHSVGGPLALHAAASDIMKDRVQSVISYGGFTDLYEMSKDQQSNPVLKFFAKPIAFLTVRDHIIDGIGSLNKLAQMKTPVLILHGEHDGAVTQRHLEMYNNKINSIAAQSKSSVNMKTVLFPGFYHEEVNNFSAAKPSDFLTVWKTIETFLKSTLIQKN